MADQAGRGVARVWERGDGWLVSMLYGFIARAGEALSFDGAVRAERAAGRTTLEVRAGLTWAFG